MIVISQKKISDFVSIKPYKKQIRKDTSANKIPTNFKKLQLISHPFAEESTGDDERDVDGVTAHDKFVKAFESSSLVFSSSVLHD